MDHTEGPKKDHSTMTTACSRAPREEKNKEKKKTTTTTTTDPRGEGVFYSRNVCVLNRNTYVKRVDGQKS